MAYEGVRVLPYCWNDETPLSAHELRMDDDIYQSRQDPAITVGFRITAPESDLDGAYLVVWTTTPGRCRQTRRWRSTPPSSTSSSRWTGAGW